MPPVTVVILEPAASEMFCTASSATSPPPLVDRSALGVSEITFPSISKSLASVASSVNVTTPAVFELAASIVKSCTSWPPAASNLSRVTSPAVLPVELVTIVSVRSTALLLTEPPAKVTSPALPLSPNSVSIVTLAPKTVLPSSVTLPPSVDKLTSSSIVEPVNEISAVVLPVTAIAAFTSTVSASTVTSLANVPVSETSRFTSSVPASPLIVSGTLKAGSIEVMSIVSLPEPPLIVSEPVGLSNETLSPSVESIIMPAPPC